MFKDDKEVSPSGGDFEGAVHKHEIVRCERCQSAFECKANSFTKCQCAKVHLTLNETQYVSELYDGCLCARCLLELQKEYKLAMGIKM